MTTEEKIIKNKVGLLRLAETLGIVSQACRVMGYSRESFYRFKELYEMNYCTPYPVADGVRDYFA